MAENEYTPPNLADILRTLSALAPPPPQQQPPNAAASNPYHFSTPIPQPRPQFEVPAPPPQRQYAHPLPQPPAAPPGPDPTCITDWPTALRCVMKSIASNERVISEIRKLIQTQHEHETQWYAGRQALVMKIDARKAGQKKVDDVLRAVGGHVTTDDIESNEVEELKAFDGKVYRAQCQMVGEMRGKLRGLGVPFFGTRGELIKYESLDGAAVSGGDGGKEGKGEGRISEGELLEMQRRMLGILEDLCAA